MTELNAVAIALIFNAIDLITGFVAALKNKNVQSGILRNGLFKKTGFLFCYVMAWLVDVYGSILGFHLSVSILPIVVFYVALTELVSIIENICKINPDILPDKLLELFHITDLK